MSQYNSAQYEERSFDCGYRNDFISSLLCIGLEEIAENILSYLDDRSLARTAAVCQEWRSFVEVSDKTL